MNNEAYISVRKDEEEKSQPEQNNQKQRCSKMDLFLLILTFLLTANYLLGFINRQKIMEKAENQLNFHKERSLLLLKLVEENSMKCQIQDSLFVQQFPKAQEQSAEPEDRERQVLDNAAKQLQQRQKDIEDKFAKQQLQNSPQQGIMKVAGIDTFMVGQAQQYVKLKDLPRNHPLAEKQRNYYEQKYHMSMYEELPFCLVVPTYNNENQNRYKHNLDSIIQQEYGNYHVVVIEDASTDRTGELIDQYVEERHLSSKIKVIHNQQQMKALPNIRRAAMEFCSERQIMMVVDGDDQLIGRQILKHFNSQFQEKGVWFMYTNFISTHGTVGYSRPFKQVTIDHDSYRKVAFMTSHLRAFYTKLLRLIKEEDLKDQNGQYFRAANDVAICIPMLQMSHKNVAYVPQISYLYNSNTGLNNHRIRLREQSANNKKIRRYGKYSPLDKLF